MAESPVSSVRVLVPRPFLVPETLVNKVRVHDALGFFHFSGTSTRSNTAASGED